VDRWGLPVHRVEAFFELPEGMLMREVHVLPDGVVAGEWHPVGGYLVRVEAARDRADAERNLWRFHEVLSEQAGSGRIEIRTGVRGALLS
jgi:hypothetical protein